MKYISLSIPYLILESMDNTQQELDTDEEDYLRDEEASTYLKDNFTFDDFWDYPATRKILQNEFLQTFNDTLGSQIADFYATERNHAHRKMANLFAFDIDGSKGGFLEAMVFNHIKKEYDIEIFYKHPEWARSFVNYHLENEKKKKTPVFIIPKKSLRTFDWATKSYKES